ncbi:DoxX family protein [Nonomuraea rosea]|uniref:DoxX family protein n=1 Tax=Nonomuraea rosea TaxID=638574 RepID=UPI0031ECC522
MNANEAISKTVPKGRVAGKALWVVQVVLGLDFIIGGSLKLLGVPSMVNLFGRIGAGQWFRYVVGSLELAGGIGVLIPALGGLAALGLVSLLTAATFTNAFIVDDPPWAPLFWLVVAAIVAWRRWPRTKMLFSGLRRRRVGLP